MLPENDQSPAQQVSQFRLVSSQTLNLSKDQTLKRAREHVSLPHSPCERDLDAKHVAELVERINAGLWLPCCWSTVEYEGVKYRMNGQHSSNAMIDPSARLNDKTVIHIDHFEADAAFGVGLLFRQFDARISTRSKMDIAGAYQGLAPELRKLDKKDCKLGIEGALWFRRNVEGLPVPSGDRSFEQLLDRSFHPFLIWFDGILSKKTPELKQVGVVAAMYGTFLKSEEKADEFWQHVSKNDLPDDSEPSSVLAVDLLKSIEEKDQRLQPGVAYAKSVTAWNGFKTGKKIRSLSVNPKRKGLPEIAE